MRGRRLYNIVSMYTQAHFSIFYNYIVCATRNLSPYAQTTTVRLRPRTFYITSTY